MNQLPFISGLPSLVSRKLVRVSRQIHVFGHISVLIVNAEALTHFGNAPRLPTRERSKQAR
jgi:hypothetical protein